jgi:ribosome biogenesis GTPase A
VKQLLSKKSKEFLERFKLDSHEISVEEAFLKIAEVRGCVRQKGLPDLERVYKLVLAEFRKGEIGKICFGSPPR